ncbi:hypothetical protein EUGRSUZ_F00812 [Eucalyptus grandis]|uniref:Uncharacterized protein n=2 Tax=Eucalyptus grandis TaxID=71139 RepID=A0ACC3KC49_EUCGR|nr:hypothetical protein EUGRSUZ_F00812 [Eucalyptus grandis]
MSSRGHNDGGPLAFIAILSIDEGEIKGIIAAVILDYLESELKVVFGCEDGGDDKIVRIANYFHTIAGTSIGGLITVMLTCPNEEGGPLFTAKEILDFYLEQSPKIFPQRRIFIIKLLTNLESFLQLIFPFNQHRAIRCLRSPKYDGKHLHNLMRKLLGKKRLHDTLTNIVIMTYDIKSSKGVTFSTRQDALLSDICISTSAAPIYLPSHDFQMAHISITKFNLVYGGVMTNNPGLVKWLYKKRDFPLLNILDEGNNTMMGKILPMHIKNLNAHRRYFRIQDDTLDGDKSSLDLATKKNLGIWWKLVKLCCEDKFL